MLHNINVFINKIYKITNSYRSHRGVPYRCEDFGLSYAPRGELLYYIHKLDCFDEKCTRFYTAETVVALDYLHSIGIIHR